MALAMDTFVQALRPPIFWRECIEQCWFIARVATLPAIAQSIAFNGMVVYLFGVAAVSFGAGDINGAGSGLATVSQIGPVSTVFVLSGAAATAMCADLGARTIREEIDAMKVLGIDPVQRLVTPRMLASGLVAMLLNSLVCIIGILGGYTFSVVAEELNTETFAAGITLLTGVPEVIISCVKALLFGLIAGLVACYRGLIISGGGAKAVGNAVNETVVYAFMSLFVVNVVVTAIGIKMTAK